MSRKGVKRERGRESEYLFFLQVLSVLLQYCLLLISAATSLHCHGYHSPALTGSVLSLVIL